MEEEAAAERERIDALLRPMSPDRACCSASGPLLHSLALLGAVKALLGLQRAQALLFFALLLAFHFLGLTLALAPACRAAPAAAPPSAAAFALSSCKTRLRSGRLHAGDDVPQ